MKQPWKAVVVYKNSDVNRIFPEHCIIKGDTVEEVLEELLKKKHPASTKQRSS